MEEKLKAKACCAIDTLSKELLDLSDKIWNVPELMFEEHQAHETLTSFFEKHGFYVKRNYPLDTAFIASNKPNRISNKPCVAVICEYDALPGIGHACGHNLIAEAGAAAAIGIKAALEDVTEGLDGHLLVMGTPAEEGGGGKILMLDKGCFDDVDFSMMVHPAPYDVVYIASLALQDVHVTFTGKAAHAAAFPWEGVNALDAAVQCYSSVSMLRQQMKPTWRVHGVFTDGGLEPAIIPERSQLHFYLRAPTVNELEIFKVKFENCCRGAAEATGCAVEIEWHGFGKDNMAYQNIRTNAVLAELYQKHAESLGIQYPPRNVQETLPTGSTDMGNVSHIIPSIHPYYCIACKGVNHTREFTESAGGTAAQSPTLIAAKAMAMTAIDVLCNPHLLENVKKAFQEQKCSEEKYNLI